MSKVHASLFSGFGGADLAAHWVGWENAFWCEIDGFCQQILRYWFPKSKGYENIKETDFTPWRGKVDVLTGGFPCQPFSVAGQRKGAADDRYLWPEMLRAIREIKPTWVVGENVAGILSMVQPGCEITVESQASLFEEADKETLLDEEYVVETVCRDLEQEGYSVQPVVIPACGVGAPHRRDRVWFVAHANGNDAGRSGYGETGCPTGSDQKSERKRERVRGNVKRTGKKRNAPYSHNIHGDLSGFRSGWLSQLETTEVRIDSNAGIQRCEKQCAISESEESRFSDRLSNASRRDWRSFPTQSPVCRGNDGLSFHVERLTLPLGEWQRRSIKGYGNAIVPQVIYEIFKAIETIQKKSDMKKFKCTVTRTDEYEIEIDETIYNEKWMKNFQEYMYPFDTLLEHAEHLAQYQARLGSEHTFIEGYGYVKRNGELPYSREDFDKNGNWLPESERRQPAPGLNIKIVNEDRDCEVEVEEWE